MFWQRFYDLCKLNDTKPNPLAKKIGISSGTLTKWKTQDVLPNGETLKKIADYLDCSVDYLLGRTDVRQINKASEYSQSVLNAADNGDKFNTKPFTPEQEAYIDKLIEKKKNE